MAWVPRFDAAADERRSIRLDREAQRRAEDRQAEADLRSTQQAKYLRLASRLADRSAVARSVLEQGWASPKQAAALMRFESRGTH
jgi:hypothetical protein